MDWVQKQKDLYAHSKIVDDKILESDSEPEVIIFKTGKTKPAELWLWNDSWVRHNSIHRLLKAAPKAAGEPQKH